MWCSKCNSHTEVNSSATGLRCRVCGSATAFAFTGPQNIQHAREILERWATADLAEQITTLPPIPSLSSVESVDRSPTQNEPAQTDSSAETKETAVEKKSVTSIGTRKNKSARDSGEADVDGEIASETQAEDLKDKDVTGSEASSEERPPSNETPPKTTEVASPKLFRKRPPTNPEESSILPTLEHERQEKNNGQVRPAASPEPARVKSSKPKSETVVATSAPPEQSDQVSADKAERRPRRLQKRNEQRRKERNRKPALSAENKGPDTVSKKFRVDTPGGEPQDLNTESTADENPQASTNSAGTRIQSNSPKGGRRHRIDTPEPLQSTLETADTRRRTSTRPRRRYIDEPHGSEVRGPHFEVTQPKRSNLTSMTGQFLAYIGVLGLTIGTAMVIYGHFGGHAQYTPTGWLVTTVAQMMLFLGVINLVSGGIEQNNTDVSARINNLGEQLMRIEQVTEEAMRGPRIDPRRYMDPDAITEDAHENAESLS